MPAFLLVVCFVIPTSAALILGSPPCCGDTSCRNRCQEDTGWDKKANTATHCHCDPFCVLHQDCCPDYYEYCKQNKTADQPAQESFRRRAECVKTNTKNSHPGTFMITSCANDWIDTKESNEQEKCLASRNANSSYTSSNITEDVPVFELGVAHATYRNVHCAKCNRVPSFTLLFWDLQIECELRPSDELSDQQKLDFMLKYCLRRSMEPDKFFDFRYCYPRLNPVSECSVGGDTNFRNSCLHDPIAIVHDKKTNTNYKNYGCFRCNGLSEHPGCGPAPSQDFFKPKSFEVVMEFEGGLRKTTTTAMCRKGQVYDPQLEICRRGKIPSLSTAIRDKYQVNTWLTPLSSGEALTTTQFRDALCEHFSLDKQQISDITKTTEGRHTSFLFNLDAGRTRQQLHNRSAPDVNALLQFNSSFLLLAANKSWTVFKVTSRQLACSKGDLYGPGEFNISVPHFRVFIYNTSESLSNKAYHLIRRNESTPLNQASVFVCRSSFTGLCSKLLLAIEKEEYAILPNKSLLRNITGEVIPLGAYELDETKAWICSDYLTDSRNATTTVIIMEESVFLWYTTIAGMSLSVLCLFLVLLTHCILPELRNPLPGKNLMSLCVSLFLAHFLWLFGSGDTDKTTFCAVTAMALHYFFLVSFACTVILAFDTWRTFSGKMSTMKGASSRGGCGARFLVYTGLAWGLPLLWVATSVGLDYFDVVEVGYGNDNACWITNTEANLISFAAPVACALIFNVAAFSQTVWAINRAKQRAAKLNTSRQNNSGALKIYARLVTLMGFSWFFGFSAVLIHTSLVYPFVIFNTSQGLYIFLAFVCKARVLKMLKQKLRPSAKSECRATQQTTTSAAYRRDDETTL